MVKFLTAALFVSGTSTIPLKSKDAPDQNQLVQIRQADPQKFEANFVDVNDADDDAEQARYEQQVLDAADKDPELKAALEAAAAETSTPEFAETQADANAESGDN